MTITLEEQLKQRPVDPSEMQRLKEEFRQYASAYRLREIREAHSMTQIDVARELGVGQNRVSQIERGDIGHSQVDTLRRYVEAIGGA